MNKDEAQFVVSNILETFELMNSSLSTIKRSCDEEEFLNYRRVIANVIASLDLDLLAQVYKKFPELEKSDHGLFPPEK